MNCNATKQCDCPGLIYLFNATPECVGGALKGINVWNEMTCSEISKTLLKITQVHERNGSMQQLKLVGLGSCH